MTGIQKTLFPMTLLVPDKTKFISPLHNRQTDTHCMTLKELCCVWVCVSVCECVWVCVSGSRCTEKPREKYEVCNMFFVFIAVDHFRNKFYCRLLSDQLKRQHRESGRNGQLLKVQEVQNYPSYSAVYVSWVHTLLKWCGASAVHFYSTYLFSLTK